jgi:hypothetical protein
MANAHSVLRYSAFCAARCASVDGINDRERIKQAAVIPLLSVTGKKSEEDDLLRPFQSDARTAFIDAVMNHLQPGRDLAPFTEMPFNRNLNEVIISTWSRTWVQEPKLNPAGDHVIVEILYLYSPVFPFPFLAQMMNKLWVNPTHENTDHENTAREIDYNNKIKLIVINTIGDDNYNDWWKKSDLIPLLYSVSLPIEG